MGLHASLHRIGRSVLLGTHHGITTFVRLVSTGQCTGDSAGAVSDILFERLGTVPLPSSVVR